MRAPMLVQPEPFEPTEDTNAAVTAFVDAMTYAQHWHTGETFHVCRLCGEVDSHVEGCPIPLIRAWQDA